MYRLCDPRRATERLILEFWRNDMWKDAEDDVDRMTITLLEEEDHRLQTTQRNARSRNSRRYVNPDREDMHSHFVKDYFSENPTFHAKIFRRRFRIRRELLVRIFDVLTNHSDYFRWKRDAVGSRYDINVLNESLLSNAVLQGNTPNIYEIFLEWFAFVKSFPFLKDSKRNKFKERQECARKDVERAFGVLQARWAIVRGPARSYYKNDLRNIMYTCIILHNMIIEDEGDESVNWSDEDSPPPARIVMGSTQEFRDYLQNYSELRDRELTSPTSSRLG
ncbi:uncharacterized protein [Henckelia pumila]|uniref:uncharacterized protein n=1 Tax=Henckelia pumila TaxID=405737 RepID=UPI003C6E07AD